MHRQQSTPDAPPPCLFPSPPSRQVLVNVSLATNNAIHPSQRGTVNGLSVVIGSLAKATGPIVSSTIFARSIHRPRPFPLDRHLIFCIFALGIVIGTATSWDIDISPIRPEPKGTAVVPVVAVNGNSLRGRRSGLEVWKEVGI